MLFHILFEAERFERRSNPQKDGEHARTRDLAHTSAAKSPERMKLNGMKCDSESREEFSA
jgi:hypothetical protein